MHEFLDAFYVKSTRISSSFTMRDYCQTLDNNYDSDGTDEPIFKIGILG